MSLSSKVERSPFALVGCDVFQHKARCPCTPPRVFVRPFQTSGPDRPSLQ